VIQNNLFDSVAGQQAKEEGMAKAAENAASLLEIAQRIAVRLASQHPDRETDMDEVGMELFRIGIKTLGPAAGSVFKGGQWQFTGKRLKSARKKNHSREIKVWRLK
jgi:hypothetical protein